MTFLPKNQKKKVLVFITWILCILILASQSMAIELEVGRDIFYKHLITLGIDVSLVERGAKEEKLLILGIEEAWESLILIQIL